MKTCNKCNIERSYSNFELERGICNSCRNEQRRLRPKKKYEINVLEKHCFRCSTTKSWDEFDKNASRQTGLSDYCKSCIAVKSRADYERRADKIKAASAARYEKLKGTEKINAPARERQKRKMQEDPKYKLARRLRNRLYYALRKKSWKKGTKFSEYIGCTLEQLVEHLENQFLPGMTWEDRGAWHIDHIIPLDSAVDETELYKLCHYTNLQPLWGEDNIRKGTKLK